MIYGRFRRMARDAIRYILLQVSEKELIIVNVVSPFRKTRHNRRIIGGVNIRHLYHAAFLIKIAAAQRCLFA